LPHAADVSHPLACRVPVLAQWTYPSWQWPPQTPAVQSGTGMFVFEHAVPHPPQLFGSVCVLTLQPFVVSVSSQFA
jgi:hypothetical protein